MSSTSHMYTAIHITRALAAGPSRQLDVLCGAVAERGSLHSPRWQERLAEHGFDRAKQ